MTRPSGTTRLFVDEALIHVRGGKGGDGCLSFRREKFVPKGGPDGGDGGHGGSVFLEAQAGLSTLLDLAGRHHWHAESGRPGMGANCAGKRGAGLLVPVPVGTLVYDADRERLLKDLVEPGTRICVARGGRGGKGNAYFVSSTNQAPREFEPGRDGQERRLRLELKLIADLGLVGLPNAGKSTLLSRLTRARPKIANYPFTTLEPQLGILELPGFRRLVLADLPGLIAGAHTGVGLGDAFLRHVERTRVIVHLIELCPTEGQPTPTEAYHVIRHELASYSQSLAERDEIVVGTKIDLTGASEALVQLQEDLGRPVLGISGVTGAGLRDLGEALWTAVQAAREREQDAGPRRLDLGAIFDSEPAAADPDLAPESDPEDVAPGPAAEDQTAAP